MLSFIAAAAAAAVVAVLLRCPKIFSRLQ